VLLLLPTFRPVAKLVPKHGYLNVYGTMNSFYKKGAPFFGVWRLLNFHLSQRTVVSTIF